MRIGLFIPCFIDAFFPEVGIATLELLERFGHENRIPTRPDLLRPADGR
jgi:L-lactate dehydrogenase complex protein LldE